MLIKCQPKSTIWKFKKTAIFCLFAYAVVFLQSCSSEPNIKQEQERPNFIILLSEDMSPEQASVLYGANYTSTPGFDSLAENGLLFNNAFASTSSCAPARASLLTCRNIWQNEEAGVHMSIFPNTFPTYVELLEKEGYHCGSSRKVWKPGYSLRGEIGGKNYGYQYQKAFRSFIESNDEDKPFHFFITTEDGHAPFEKDKWKMYKDQIETMIVPPFLPQNQVTKQLILNANYELEKFDLKIKEIISLLKEYNELENTVFIVSSDNGTTLSGNGKGLGAYRTGCRVPMAISWPNGIKQPGRIIEDIVTQIDISKTILALAKVQPAESMTEGQSLTNIFASNNEGLIEKHRDRVYLGFERHAFFRPQEQSCYPVRSILTLDYQYVWNLEPERHIWGPKNQHYYRNGEGGISEYISNHNNEQTSLFLDAFTKKRPEEEFFDLKADPSCLNNLAEDPAYSQIIAELKSDLLVKLKTDKDPRILGKGRSFDQAPYPPNKMKNAKIEPCVPFSPDYRSYFDRSHYPKEIRDRPWYTSIVE